MNTKTSWHLHEMSQGGAERKSSELIFGSSRAHMHGIMVSFLADAMRLLAFLPVQLFHINSQKKVAQALLCCWCNLCLPPSPLPKIPLSHLHIPIRHT